jgi:hypothetical protein
MATSEVRQVAPDNAISLLSFARVNCFRSDQTDACKIKNEYSMKKCRGFVKRDARAAVDSK